MLLHKLLTYMHSFLFGYTLVTLFSNKGYDMLPVVCYYNILAFWTVCRPDIHSHRAMSAAFT